MSYEIPRRDRLDKNTPAELAIRAAVDAVEVVGAHPMLTEVVILLDHARRRLADYVDRREAFKEMAADGSGDEPMPAHPTSPPPSSSYRDSLIVGTAKARLAAPYDLADALLCRCWRLLMPTENAVVCPSCGATKNEDCPCARLPKKESIWPAPAPAEGSPPASPRCVVWSGCERGEGHEGACSHPSLPTSPPAEPTR